MKSRTRMRLGRPRPNPAVRQAVIDFSVPCKSVGSLTIFDSQGRIVRRLFRGMSEPGATRSVWDLRTDSGREVPGGIYFYKLQFPTFSAGGKLTVSR